MRNVLRARSGEFNELTVTGPIPGWFPRDLAEQFNAARLYLLNNYQPTQIMQFIKGERLTIPVNVRDTKDVRQQHRGWIEKLRIGRAIWFLSKESGPRAWHKLVNEEMSVAELLRAAKRIECAADLAKVRQKANKARATTKQKKEKLIERTIKRETAQHPHKQKWTAVDWHDYLIKKRKAPYKSPSMLTRKIREILARIRPTRRKPKRPA
jgi:hypothetical protein